VTPARRRQAARRALLFALALCVSTLGAAGRVQPGSSQWAQVEFVIDGDTFVLADGPHVRLIGINAPEVGKDDVPDEPLAQAARAQLERMLGGKRVKLLFGREAYDHYGRLLAHAWLADGQSVEETLLRLGLAVQIAIPPNIERTLAYEAAESAARAARRGIWANAYYDPVAAEHLRPGQSGFHFVAGRIYEVWRSHRYVHLVLTPRLDVLVALTDLQYFPTPPEAFTGKRVIVRGWITSHQGRLQIRVGDPAMLSFTD
jgi:micrococcal nuclease